MQKIGTKPGNRSSVARNSNVGPHTLSQCLRLSAVPRWSIVYTIQTQSVAEHSFNMTAIAVFLLDSGVLPDLDPAELLRYALEHDAEEAITGDMPSTAKAPETIDSDLARAVKIADVLEALVFITREIHMGNRTVENVRSQLVARLRKLIDDTPPHWPTGPEGVWKKCLEVVTSTTAKFHPGLLDLLDEGGQYNGG